MVFPWMGSRSLRDQLCRAGIPICRDRVRRLMRQMGNVFIERLWRSIKYEEIYLRADDTVAEASAGIRRYPDFYSSKRTHQALGRGTPDEIYFQSRGLRKAA